MLFNITKSIQHLIDYGLLTPYDAITCTNASLLSIWPLGTTFNNTSTETHAGLILDLRPAS